MGCMGVGVWRGEGTLDGGAAGARGRMWLTGEEGTTTTWTGSGRLSRAHSLLTLHAHTTPTLRLSLTVYMAVLLRGA